MYILNEKIATSILLLLIGTSFSGCGNQSTNESEAVIEIPPIESGNFISIFDGKTLDNWEGDTAYWRVEDGKIIGEVTPETPLKTNTFLIWKGGEPADFELKADFKISQDGNSGINYRSEKVQDIPFALRGYQADIDGNHTYTGQNYEERKRTTLAYRGQKTLIHPQDPPGEIRENVVRNAWLGLEVIEDIGNRDSLKNIISKQGWNTIHLVAKDNVLKHYVNGILMSEVVDQDTVNRKMKGLLGIQAHAGPPMQVQFRNIQIKEFW